MEIIFFEDGPFALKLGEASDIAEARFGYHLIEGTDKKPETKVPYAEVKDSIERKLKQKKAREEIDLYVNNLKEKADIERFPERESN